MNGICHEYRDPKQYIYAPTGKNVTPYPLNRPIPKTPIYQGENLACVSCSISACAEFLDPFAPSDWEILHAACDVRGEGVRPTQALETARQWGWISAYYEITNRTRNGLFEVLERAPVMVGVPVHELIWAGTSPTKPIQWDGQRDYGHMCVLWDVTPDGDWVILNWAKSDAQDVRVLSKDYPIDIAYFCTKTVEKAAIPTRAGRLGAFFENTIRFAKKLL